MTEIKTPKHIMVPVPRHRPRCFHQCYLLACHSSPRMGMTLLQSRNWTDGWRRSETETNSVCNMGLCTNASRAKCLLHRAALHRQNFLRLHVDTASHRHTKDENAIPLHLTRTQTKSVSTGHEIVDKRLLGWFGLLVTLM